MTDGFVLVGVLKGADAGWHHRYLVWSGIAWTWSTSREPKVFPTEVEAEAALRERKPAFMNIYKSVRRLKIWPAEKWEAHRVMYKLSDGRF
jgi:hypothetical protein